MELRKLVGQGRLDFCQGFPHLKEFSDLVGQVTKEVDKEASFDRFVFFFFHCFFFYLNNYEPFEKLNKRIRWLALWHSREVFTLQKFKSFLTSEEWPDFPLPLTAKKAFEHFKSGKKANEEEQDSVLDEEEEVHPVEKGFIFISYIFCFILFLFYFSYSFFSFYFFNLIFFSKKPKKLLNLSTKQLENSSKISKQVTKQLEKAAQSK